MSRLCRKLAVLLVVLLVSGSIWSQAAYALIGKARYEYDTDWRGVAAQVWLYAWDLPAGGEHVSSIYIRDKRGVDRHVEAGIDKVAGEYPTVFYQWRKVDDIDEAAWGSEWYQRDVKMLTGSLYYTNFEINNVDMGGAGDPGDNWRASYNGIVMTTVYLPGVIAGDVTCCSEVLNEGDDNRSSFRDLKKKNNAGSWSLWTNALVFPLTEEDDTHHWHFYSPSHWYVHRNH